MESSGTPLAKRIRSARNGRGWTLDELADVSGVSRAMISKIERDEVSPTAAILARLAAGLGVSLASLFSDPSEDASALARAGEQPVWTDPATGYVRRNVSPGAARGAAEIVDVTFPPGGWVVFDNATVSQGIVQQVWVIEGRMEMTVGEETTGLGPGDCLFMRLDRPLVFHNPGSRPARYAVVLSRFV